MFKKKAMKYFSYPFILYRTAGYKMFILEIARRIYNKSHFIRFELELDSSLPKILSSIDLTT